MLALLGASSGCRGSDPPSSAQALVTAEPESSVERRVASIEDELRRISDPEARLAERRLRFDEETRALRAGSIDTVDSYERQVALRNRLMGSAEAEADARAAAEAAFARHESYAPTRGDLELSDAERAHGRALVEEWERVIASRLESYLPAPAMPEDSRERDRRIAEERRILEAAGARTVETEVLP